MRNVLPAGAAAARTAALAAVAAVAVAVSGCSGGSPGAAGQSPAATPPATRPQAAVPRLHWHQCSGAPGQLRCARLRVPDAVGHELTHQ